MKNKLSVRSSKTKKPKSTGFRKRLRVLVKKIDRNTKTLKNVKVLMKKQATIKGKSKIVVRRRKSKKVTISATLIPVLTPTTFDSIFTKKAKSKKPRNIKHSKGRFVPVDPETRVYDDIARNSRGPFCKTAPRAFKEDHNKGAVDSTFLARADFEQIEHEHRLEVPYVGLFKNSHTGEIAHEHDSECDCKDGETCEICVTKKDLDAVPPCKMEVVETIRDPLGHRQFKVKLPVEIAESLERVV